MPLERFVMELRRALPDALHETDGRAVLAPASAHELAQAVGLAHRLGGSLRPPGGESRPEAVEVDLRRLDDVLAFDGTTRLVHVQAGMLVAELEAQLERRGMTLGLCGPAPEVPLGRWLAEGAPGARAHADDPVDQRLAGLELILPDGRELVVRPAPRRAVGPDLASAIVGGRGRLGIVTAVHFLTRSRTPVRTVAFRLPTPEGARAALAWVRGRGVRPLNSAIETGQGSGAADGALLVLRLGGPDPRIEASLRVVHRTVADHGGEEADAPEELPIRRGPNAPLDPLVDALAQELDPHGVLGRT